MDVLASLRDKIMSHVEILENQEKIFSGLDKSSITVETPKDSAFGDLSSNVAMVLSKQVNRSPRELAQFFVNQFSKDHSIESVEVAGMNRK